MKKTSIILIIAAILTPIGIRAEIYSVSPSGDDSNSGTIALPWRTIAKANATLQAGDTVLIREGTYREQIKPAANGSDGAHITYQGYPGETAVITGLVPVSGLSLYSESVYQATLPRVYRGVYVDGSMQADVGSVGEVDQVGEIYHSGSTIYVYLPNGPGGHTVESAEHNCVSINRNHHLTIKHLNLLYGRNACIWMEMTSNILIASNRIGNPIKYSHSNCTAIWCVRNELPSSWDIEIIGNEIFSANGSSTVTGEGCAINVCAMEDSLIENNVIHDWPQQWQLKDNGHRVMIRGNIQYDSGGIALGPDSTGNWVTENIVIGSRYGVSVVPASCPDNEIYNNVFYDVDMGIRIGAANTKVKNNIFRLSGNGYQQFILVVGGSTHGLQSDYNCYYGYGKFYVHPQWYGGPGGTQLSSWQASYSLDLQSIETDPQFVDEAGRDFRLLAGSDCIDAGDPAFGTDPVDGSNIDIGAYPWIGSGPEPGVMVIATITDPTTQTVYNTTNDSVSIAGTASITEGSISAVSWDNAQTGAGGPAGGTTSWSVGPISLDMGANTITVTATDGAGHVGADVITVTRTVAPVDDIPPFVSGHLPVPGAVDVYRNVNVTLHVEDMGLGVDASTIRLFVGGVEVTPVLEESSPDDIIVTYDPPVDFDAQETVTVEVEASDLAVPANVMTGVVYSFTTGSEIDTVPPAEPEGLSAEVVGSGLRLTWRPNTELDLAGYRLHWGTSTGQYGNTRDVGNLTTFELTGLDDGTYYLALSAYDGAGNESATGTEASGVVGSEQGPVKPRLSVDGLVVNPTVLYGDGSFRILWDALGEGLQLKVHSIFGGLVRTFESGEAQTRDGYRETVWTPGEELSSGIYIISACGPGLTRVHAKVSFIR